MLSLSYLFKQAHTLLYHPCESRSPEHNLVQLLRFCLTDLCGGVQLLRKNPKDRVELHMVLQHPWIIGNADPSVL